MLRDIVVDVLEKGGKGSGFFAPRHQGRIGQIGGSTSENVAAQSSGRRIYTELLTIDNDKLNDPKEVARANRWTKKHINILLRSGKQNVTVKKINGNNKTIFTIEYDMPVVQVDPKPDESVSENVDLYTPVSVKKKITVPSTAKTEAGKKIYTNAREIIDAIDSIHKMPSNAPVVNVHVYGLRSGFGEYRYGTDVSTIRVSSKRTENNEAEETITHEMGHWLDHALGKRFTKYKQSLFTDVAYKPDSNADPAIKDAIDDWVNAVMNSQAVNELAQTKHKKTLTKLIRTKNADGSLTVESKSINVDRKIVRYFLSTAELFARSYSQYIGTKTGRKGIMDAINKVKQGSDQTFYPQHWTDDDFKPIYHAMENILKTAGLLNE